MSDGSDLDVVGATVVATGLASPWGVAPLPDGSALVTVRDTGEVLLVRSGAPPAPLGVVPGVRHGGEGGLLGIAVSPGFADDGVVVVYATSATDNRVLRMRLTEGVLEPDVVILDGIPRADYHDGGRIAFGPDGFLYVATGDAGEPGNAQDLGSLGGKILRITADGAPAPGNPIPGSPLWSWGHRNVQGIAWHEDGRMFASELGESTWDELNLVEPGRNYGWPLVEGQQDASDRPGDGDVELVDPLVEWPTQDASPSGVAVVGDVVYVAALRGESLWRVPLVGNGAGEPQRLIEGVLGRLRAVADDGRGHLWVTTSNTTRGSPRPGDDRVILLTEAVLGRTP